MQLKKLYSSLIATAVMAALPLAAQAGSSGGVQVTPGYIPSYSTVSTFFTPPSSAGNISWSLTNSGSRTIYILSITISRVSSGAGADEFAVAKRTGATTGGTGSTITEVPFDTASGSSGAVTTSYTAVPTTGGGGGFVGSGALPQAAVASNLPLFTAPLPTQALVLHPGQSVEVSGVTAITGTEQIAAQYLAQ